MNPMLTSTLLQVMVLMQGVVGDTAIPDVPETGRKLPQKGHGDGADATCSSEAQQRRPAIAAPSLLQRDSHVKHTIGTEDGAKQYIIVTKDEERDDALAKADGRAEKIMKLMDKGLNLSKKEFEDLGSNSNVNNSIKEYPEVGIVSRMRRSERMLSSLEVRAVSITIVFELRAPPLIGDKAAITAWAATNIDAFKTVVWNTFSARSRPCGLPSSVGGLAQLTANRYSVRQAHVYVTLAGLPNCPTPASLNSKTLLKEALDANLKNYVANVKPATLYVIPQDVVFKPGDVTNGGASL
eukprot:TRINITY_DN48234_c0_g1_i1.p1 TRINITY_DN48234_c0_g1~~TRINITY_DN48234_c0_g1_i1.p1  ORF type:complete len:296 (+),score=25.85 TRINITY_DN48234_c0_g1_i1:70-957(+)